MIKSSKIIAVLILSLLAISCASNTNSRLIGKWIHNGQWPGGQDYSITLIFHENGELEEIGKKSSIKSGKGFSDSHLKRKWEVLEQDGNVMDIVLYDSSSKKRTLKIKLINNNTFRIEENGETHSFVRQ